MMKMYGDDAAKLMDSTPEAIHERENDVREAILRGQQVRRYFSNESIT